MPLSEAEKQRIREEEFVRLEAREEYHRGRRPVHPSGLRSAMFWIALVLFAMFFWVWIRRAAG